jgi:hypothetical protein
MSRRIERGWFSDRGGDGSPRCIRVGENLIDVSKIECRGVLTVRPEVLDGHAKECSNCSRK